MAVKKSAGKAGAGAEDVLSIIKRRKTTFEFTGKKVGAPSIKKILEAGRWAPSSHNSQPWNFIVVTDKKAISNLMDICFYGFFHSLPTAIIVAVLSPPEKSMPGMFRGKNSEMAFYHKFIDIGQPILSMAYVAESLGIDSCILSLQIKDANRLLGVPAAHQAILAIGLGYEKENAFQSPHAREKIQKLVFSERFGRKG